MEETSHLPDSNPQPLVTSLSLSLHKRGDSSRTLLEVTLLGISLGLGGSVLYWQQGLEWFKFLPYSTIFFYGLELLPMACKDAIEPKKTVPRSFLIAFAVIFLNALLLVIVMGCHSPGSSAIAAALRDIPPAYYGYTHGLHVGKRVAKALSIPALFATSSALVRVYSNQLHSMAESSLLPAVLKCQYGSDEVPYVALVVTATLILMLMVIAECVCLRVILIANVVAFHATSLIGLNILAAYFCFHKKFISLPRAFAQPLGLYGVGWSGILLLLAWTTAIVLHENSYRTALIFLGFVVFVTIVYGWVIRLGQGFSAEEQKVMFIAYVINSNRRYKLKASHRASFSAASSATTPSHRLHAPTAGKSPCSRSVNTHRTGNSVGSGAVSASSTAQHSFYNPSAIVDHLLAAQGDFAGVCDVSDDAQRGLESENLLSQVDSRKMYKTDRERRQSKASNQMHLTLPSILDHSADNEDNAPAVPAIHQNLCDRTCSAVLPFEMVGRGEPVDNIDTPISPVTRIQSADAEDGKQGDDLSQRELLTQSMQPVQRLPSFTVHLMNNHRVVPSIFSSSSEELDLPLNQSLIAGVDDEGGGDSTENVFFANRSSSGSRSRRNSLGSQDSSSHDGAHSPLHHPAALPSSLSNTSSFGNSSRSISDKWRDSIRGMVTGSIKLISHVVPEFIVKDEAFEDHRDNLIQSMLGDDMEASSALTLAHGVEGSGGSLRHRPLHERRGPSFSLLRSAVLRGTGGEGDTAARYALN
eukprot:gene9079-10021_t